MATIKQIDDRTVHRIQSGQVIIDLCSVVKELVENSIDAGATTVEVRFKNQGLDTIEVLDNGSGIAPDNYASVALKHHTSKLSSYSDIALLQTFGFRGEALASLCALSNFTVVTCLASDVPKGSKLTFEPSGKLQTTTVVAAQRGTAVTVEKLFHNLPVRRRELERNIKREWQKVISLLNQYACIQTNLKFSVSQQPSKGKRIVLFSTKGNDSTRDNLINIFGAKTMTTLLSLDLKLKLQPSMLEPGMQALVESRFGSNDVRVVGHVSRPIGGEGRQTPDRQMFFINGRPCALPQFAKAFNEVYRSYNSNQSPFIFADIQLDTGMYDVNVSPDKRTILLHDQPRLLDTLRSSLASLFDSHEYSVPLSRPLVRQKTAPPNHSKASVSEQVLVREEATKAFQASKPSTEAVDEEAISDSSNEDETASKRPVRRLTSRSLRENGPDQRLITPWVSRGVSASSASASRSPSPAREKPSSTSPKPTEISYAATFSTTIGQRVVKPLPVEDFNKRIAEFSAIKSSDRTPVPRSPPSSTATHELNEPAIPAVKLTSLMPARSKGSSQVRRSSRKTSPEFTSISIGDRQPTRSVKPATSRQHEDVPESSEDEHPVSNTPVEKILRSGSDDELSDSGRSVSSSKNESAKEDSVVSDPQAQCRTTSSEEAFSHPNQRSTDTADDLMEGSHKRTTEPDTNTPIAEPRAVSFQSGNRRKDTTLQLLQRIHTNESLVFEQMSSWTRSVLEVAITPPEQSQVEDIDAKDAEAKLALIISRPDFARMRVAGQFNLGFIIATRFAGSTQGSGEPSEGDELFIVDQHASDEKYNFERLQNTTTVQSQPLVHHKRLELTALEEEIIMQNKDAIEANGFKFNMDLSGEVPVGSRCQLTALPLSRETTFDVTDFEELVALLGDESSESSRVPRPSKVRKMFAMRACRSSIMIGRPLTKSQMYTLLKHMGEMDKPWNCPHGRPTMRHLCRLQAWDNKSWKGDMEAKTASTWQMYGAGN